MPVTSGPARGRGGKALDRCRGSGERDRQCGGTMPAPTVLALAMLAVAVLATACGGESGPDASSPPASSVSSPGSSTVSSPGSSPSADAITVTSPAVAAGGQLPARFTCDGAGAAPPLSWSGVPDAAVSLAVVVDDPDAPGGTYTHWVVAGLPPEASSIDATALPAGAVQAVNSAGSTGYTPPCPPSGEHRYRFTVLALSVDRPFADGAGTDDALAAVRQATIASGTLVARYARG